ncbi:MAG: DUF2953 domain-containing protein [Clostridia bacterium]|nr:DUF2953 domain-containing protein [Clostridia bacterium]
MPLLIYTSALLGFLILISFFSVDFQFKYTKDCKNNHIFVGFSTIYGLINYQFQVPLKNWIFMDMLEELEDGKFRELLDAQGEQESTNFFSRLLMKVPDLQRLYSIVLQSLQINTWLYRHIICKKFVWVSRFGLGDASYTGLGVGLIWTVKGWTFNNLVRNVRTVFVDTPKIDVQPNYQREEIETQFDCIFTLAMGHIIIAALRFVSLAAVSSFALKGVKG